MNDDQNKPPEHPNCRSVIIPIPRWMLMAAYLAAWKECVRLVTWKN